MSSLVWVELDAEAPEHNLTQLRKNAEPGVLFCAVIKSNAYGHGAAQIRSMLPSADWLGVNSLEEGLELRGWGEKRPIVLLGHVPLNRLAEAVEADLSLTVYNPETLRALSALPRSLPPARLHLKIETGTGRQGIMAADLDGYLDGIRAAAGARLEGVSTHFANIEDTLNHAYAQKQLETFESALRIIEKKAGRPPIIHAACTAATILFPKTHFTMLRSGIGLYGLWPSRETFLSAQAASLPMPELRPVLSWKTRIVQIKEVPEGSYIGYGCSYRTTRRTVVGVLPVGYSDGYDRALGNRAHILVKGKRAAVIGRICMNLCMADLTDIPGVRLEEEAVLLGRSGDETISAETMAEWAGTINYEVVTRISPLLPREVVRQRA